MLLFVLTLIIINIVTIAVESKYNKYENNKDTY